MTSLGNMLLIITPFAIAWCEYGWARFGLALLLALNLLLLAYQQRRALRNAIIASRADAFRTIAILARQRAATDDVTLE